MCNLWTLASRSIWRCRNRYPVETTLVAKDNLLIRDRCSRLVVLWCPNQENTHDRISLRLSRGREKRTRALESNMIPRNVI